MRRGPSGLLHPSLKKVPGWACAGSSGEESNLGDATSAPPARGSRRAVLGVNWTPRPTSISVKPVVSEIASPRVLPVALLTGCGGGGGDADPESARCTSPSATFGDATRGGDHREVAVHYTCVETELAGTLYLPSGAGRHPAVVWVHGSGEQPRLNYGPIVAGLVEDGIAVFSYDKRGVAESGGDCCTSPGTTTSSQRMPTARCSPFDRIPMSTPTRSGLYGASEAGWVVPLANARLSKPVAFTALVDGPAVTTGEEKVWSDAAGEGDEAPLTEAKKAEATQRLEEAGPSGFDPAPYIEQLSTPGLWLYGGGDKSIPTDRSVEILTRLKRAGKDFTIVVFPVPGTDWSTTFQLLRKRPRRS